jgi:flagellar basal-body rod protein FlgB
MQVNSFMDDDAFKAARVALSGMAKKGETISQNVANIDTPGYEAQTVSFEQAVRNVINREEGNDLTLAKTSTAHLASPYQPAAIYQKTNRTGGNYRADGNNVDIEVEFMDMNETVMRYETLTQLLAKRYKVYKDIAQS